MNGLMNTGVPPTVSPAASPASVVETAVQGAVQKIQGRREQLREQTDRKIMRATLEIMISKGVAAVTIEEVARRSGVAKTTIYRRYKNADDLLQRIQLEVAGLPDFSDLQPSRSGLQAMLERRRGALVRQRFVEDDRRSGDHAGGATFCDVRRARCGKRGLPPWTGYEIPVQHHTGLHAHL